MYRSGGQTITEMCVHAACAAVPRSALPSFLLSLSPHAVLVFLSLVTASALFFQSTSIVTSHDNSGTKKTPRRKAEVDLDLAQSGIHKKVSAAATRPRRGPYHQDFGTTPTG